MVADVLIIIVLGLAGRAGFRSGLVAQLSGALGLGAGFCIAALLCAKFMFLTEQSWLRFAILVVIAIVSIVLCYDLMRGLGHYLQMRYPQFCTRLRKSTVACWSSVGIGALTALFVVWLLGALLLRAGPSMVRGYIAHSTILASLSRSVPFPGIFQDALYLARPFGEPPAFVTPEPSFVAIQNPDQPLQKTYAALDTAIAAHSSAVVKIQSWGCGSATVGSGFMVGRRLVMTNAHVVAGVDRVSIHIGQKASAGRIVLFDPDLDIALISTDDTLPGLPLTIQADLLPAGSVVAIMGYPNGDAFMAGDGVILQRLDAAGYDIYGKKTITRSIYAIRGDVVPGNSGGPLITSKGEVVGLVFGHSDIQNHTGYALTSDQLTRAMAAAANTSPTINTGPCGVR